MNLALSNFAWNFDETHDIFQFLKDRNIKNVELVLTKYKPWEEINRENLVDYKQLINSYDLNAYSIQSLFYNVTCSVNEPETIINHLKKLIDYSQLLGTKILVFGSPNLRKKVDDYQNKLITVFKEVDAYLENKDVKVIIEPNTSKYGGEYFFNLDEIASFILNNNLKNIKTMVDTHNLLLENLDPIKELDKFYSLIYHIHVSEEKLAFIKDDSFHRNFSNRLKELNYNGIITYEVMKADNIKESIDLFKKIYDTI